jgi:hypothetical protein
MTEIPVKKIYVDNDRMVNFTCPQCGITKKESAYIYKSSPEAVTIGCTCQNVYVVKIGFRRAYRKRTNLSGSYTAAKREIMTVKNISMGGGGFEVKLHHGLIHGDNIKFEFHLDNNKRSLIKKNATICVIKGNYIGCRFIDPPGSLDPDLGFYLRTP